jgi:carboxymethylenebutenolidase
MGENITLTSKDGFQFGAYKAEPEGKPRGAIVVIQEIFGVNHHIRSIADRYAQLGYVAIAPSLFDRGEKGFESGYDGAAMDKARGFTAKISLDDRLADTQAAIDAVKSVGKVAVVGFCMGGSIAFLSTTRLNGVSAAVGYYGGQIAQFATEKPKAPILLHFGEKDQSIPLTDVEKIRAAQPGAPIYVYNGAGHGFHCDERGSFNAEAAQVAGARTQDFLTQHIG